GTIRKDPGTVRLRFALCFPEVYEIAQSHLGLQILYDVLNRRPEVAAERAYAPWPDLEALLRARGLPLVSLESHLPLAGFHVPAFFAPRYHADGTIAEVVPLEPARARVAKRVLVDLDRFAPPANPVVPNVGVVHDRASVEVMRGCVKGCRFCQAGYIYRPLRERNPERLVEQTAELMRRTGYEEVSLLSLSTGDYSGVNPLLKELMDRLVPERVA